MLYRAFYKADAKKSGWQYYILLPLKEHPPSIIATFF